MGGLFSCLGTLWGDCSTSAMRPYVTVYDKETGKSQLIYAASLQEFLRTGRYSTEAPGAPKKPEELKKAELPTAGREEGRPASLEVLQTPDPEEPKAEEPKAEEEKTEEKPAASRKAPRRRSAPEE